MVGQNCGLGRLVLHPTPLWIFLTKHIGDNMRVHLLSSNTNCISNDILNLTQHKAHEVKLISGPNGEEKPLIQASQRLPVAPTGEDSLPQSHV